MTMNKMIEADIELTKAKAKFWERLAVLCESLTGFVSVCTDDVEKTLAKSQGPDFG